MEQLSALLNPYPSFQEAPCYRMEKKIEGKKKTKPSLETLTNIFNFAAPEIPARRKKFGSSLWFVLFSRFQLHQQLYQCKSNYASCLLISRALTLAAEAYLGVSGASAFLGDRTGTPQKLLRVVEGV